MTDEQPRMPSLDELVASAQHRRMGGHGCWATLLPPDAQQYVEKLEAIEAETPLRVNRSQVSRDLRRYFQVDVGPSGVKKHFSGGCTCGKF